MDYEELQSFLYDYSDDLFWLIDFTKNMFVNRFANPTDLADLVPFQVLQISFEDFNPSESTSFPEDERLADLNKPVINWVQAGVQIVGVACIVFICYKLIAELTCLSMKSCFAYYFRHNASF